MNTIEDALEHAKVLAIESGDKVLVSKIQAALDWHEVGDYNACDGWDGECDNAGVHTLTVTAYGQHMDLYFCAACYRSTDAVEERRQRALQTLRDVYELRIATGRA